MAEERLDIVDGSAKPLGVTKSRAAVHRDGDWHTTVHVWIVNNCDEILFQKRSPAKDSFPGMWDVSAAGHVSAGESTMHAAQRETLQELGVRAGESELHRLCTVRTASLQHSGAFIDNEFSEVFVMRKDLCIRALALQRTEVAGAMFLPKAGLKRLALLGDPAFAPHPEEYRLLSEHLSKRKKPVRHCASVRLSRIRCSR